MEVNFFELGGSMKIGNEIQPRKRDTQINPSWSTLFTSSLVLAGVAIGAGFMFLLDPLSGRARRARIAEKSVKTRNLAFGYGGKYGRHFRNLATGILARLKPRITKRAFDDLTIRDRIRSEMGRKVRHAGAIEVAVVNGEARLSGPVLKDEVEELISAVKKVDGVRHVQNLLEVHLEAGKVPGLQGEGKLHSRKKKTA